VSKPLRDEEREAEAAKGRIENKKFANGCLLVAPVVEEGRARLRARLSGFCPVALSEGRGLLLPGCPRIGLLRFGDHHYAFSTAARAERFGADPAAMISRVERAARQNPALERLIGLRQTNVSKVNAKKGRCISDIVPTIAIF